MPEPAPALATTVSPAALASGPGPLYNIGRLVDSGVDGVMIPEGFQIRRVASVYTNPVTGIFDPLGASGYVWHAAPDGGAVFPTSDGGWIYVNNSEVGLGGAVLGSSQNGGVGALKFAPNGQVVDAYRILDNTRRNCAGGATPWGTWISCEEQSDGNAFECDPTGMLSAMRKPALGTFNMEAAAVDLPTRTVYITEDAGDGRFYRFRAAESDLLMDNGVARLRMETGVLEVLNIEGFENNGYITDDAEAQKVRRVSWIPVVDPQLPQSGVRARLAMENKTIPGTIFRGGEGIWHYTVSADDVRRPVDGTKPLRALVYFACKGDNRVFALDIDNDLVQTVFDNSFIDLPFDDVDNLVVSPAGDVVVAEDGDAMRLMVVFPGMPAKTLLQITGGGSELTGPAFTPDGSRLYFNSQRGPNFPLQSLAGMAPLINQLPGIRNGLGVTYEVLIPEEFRQRALTA